MQNAVSTCWVASGALFGVLASLSNPDYYLGATVSLVFLVVAYRSFTVPNNKRILVISYIVLAIYSFAVGRTMFGGHQLTDVGVFAMFLTMAPVVYLAWRFYKTESAAA